MRNITNPSCNNGGIPCRLIASCTQELSSLPNEVATCMNTGIVQEVKMFTHGPATEGNHRIMPYEYRWVNGDPVGR